jgi:hypothetical protein
MSIGARSLVVNGVRVDTNLLERSIDDSVLPIFYIMDGDEFLML